MTWKKRIAIIEQNLAVESKQAYENWSNSEKISRLEELKTMEIEHHKILHEIGSELNRMQLRHTKKEKNVIDITNPQSLIRLEALSARSEELSKIKKQLGQIMNEEKKIVWKN